MRGVPLVCFALLTSLVSAQTPQFAPLVKAILDKQKNQPRALEPQGTQPQKSRSGTLPAPLDQGSTVEVIESGKWKQENGIVKVTDGAHLKYRGYDLFAKEIDLDRKNEFAILRDNVRVIGKDAVVTGGLVRVNFNDRSFEAEDGYAILRPSFVNGRLQSDLFVTGGKSFGTEREVHTHDGGLTTCELEHPHYVIESRNGLVRPGKRAILRNARIEVLGKTILGLPYISIPLEERSDRYLPEVGQSQEEGYFVKSKIPIALKGNNNFLDARVDYMTKLGSGLGANFDYEGAGQGYVRLYTLIGTQRRTAEVINQHSQRFGKLRISLSNNYQKANYFNAPENTSLNNQIRLSYGSSNLTYSRYSNDSNQFSNLQQLVGFSDSRMLSSYGRVTNRSTLEVNFSSSKSEFSGSDPVKREQMDVRLRGIHDAPIGSLELEYARTIPIGSTENFFGAAEKTPVLSFRTDSSRLMGSKWTKTLPLDADLSFGEFSNPSTGERISRAFIDLGARIDPQDRSRGNRFSVRADGRLRQGIYSDDTAQYATAFNGAATYRLGASQKRGLDPSLNLRYSYLEFHGFTPLDIDRSGRANYTSVDLSVNPLRRVSLGASTGYDFNQEQLQQTAWQTLGVRLDWEPVDGLSLRSFSTYDPFQKAWSNVRLDVPQFKFRGATIAAGARYDGIRQTWGAANLFVDGIKWGRLKMSSLLAYNGYLQKFEARHFSFTYDLHCAEAVLQILDNPTGFRPGRTVYFFFRLKALPSDTPFGLGRQGSSFGTGTGRDGF